MTLDSADTDSWSGPHQEWRWTRWSADSWGGPQEVQLDITYSHIYQICWDNNNNRFDLYSAFQNTQRRWDQVHLETYTPAVQSRPFS